MADAQSTLAKKVHLSHKIQTLGETLNDIESETDFHFTYSIQKVNIDQPVNLPKEMTVMRFLNHTLASLNIQHTIFNNNIVLSRNENPKILAGTSLHGNVVSQLGEPIFFANVVLTRGNDDLNFLLGAVTDELGKFRFNDLSHGSYKLSISFLGFETLDTTIDVQRSLNLGSLTLHQQVNVLKDVNVVSQRKLIQQKIDRLVVDIENSMLASRGSALDVVAATPGVSVQNDRINMIGKSSVGILIDNKLIKLPPDEIANFLRSISSEDIKNIEVISTPPAKYEAEGNSGLIHIVLKKAVANSWNASVRAGYSKKTRSAGNAGASYSYNKNKLSIASSVFYNKGFYYQEQDDYAHFADGLWHTISPILSDYERFNGRLDVNYKLKPNWSIGGQFVRNKSDYIVTDNPYTPVLDYETNEIQSYLLSTFSQMNWKPRFSSINLNSAVDLDSLGKKMQINLDYFRFDNEDIRRYEGESVIFNPQSIQYYHGINNNFQGIDNISFGVDFDLPTAWAEISLGSKVTHSTSTNDISLFNTGLTEEPLPARDLDANDFTYDENIQALYLSLTRSLSEKLKAQLGARLELTQTTSTSVNLSLNEKNQYARIFPTLYLSYKVSDLTSYSITYSRRISRPNFGQLNPNIFFVNPFQTIVGNAFLQPSFTDNVEISVLKGNLSTKVYYSREEDIFTQVPIPDPDTKIITFANENYVNTRRFGLSIYYVFDQVNWWRSTNSADVNFLRSSFDLEIPHDDLTGFNSTISTSNDFKIKAVDGLSINVGYRYKLPGTNYIFDTGKASNLSASIQWHLLDKKLKFSLTGNDLLKDDADILETTVNGIYQTARYYYDMRTVSLSASYNFGNQNISAKRHKTSNSDERRRTGN